MVTSILIGLSFTIIAVVAIDGLRAVLRRAYLHRRLRTYRAAIVALVCAYKAEHDAYRRAEIATRITLQRNYHEAALQQLTRRDQQQARAALIGALTRN